MSIVLSEKLIAGRFSNQTTDSGDNTIVYAIAGKPVFGEANSTDYDVDVQWPLWGVTWILNGKIDFSNFNITALFSVSIPNVGTFALSNVNGNLQSGVGVSFDISSVTGTARFFIKSGYLYVTLGAKVFGISHNAATVQLLPLPI